MAPHDGVQIKELRGDNPFDWLRLYMWIFFQPARRLDYEAQFGERSAWRIGNWLALAMALLPLFIPTLAALFGNFSWNSNDILPSPGIALGLLFAIWLLVASTALINWNPSIFIFLLGFAVPLCIIASLEIRRMGILAMGGAVFTATIVTSATGRGRLGGTVALLISVSVGIPVIAVIGRLFRVMSNSLGSARGILIPILLVLSTLFMVVLEIVGQIINQRLRNGNGTPAWWQILLGLLAPLSYAVLIAVYWFGVQLP